MVQDSCFCGKPARGFAREHRKDTDHYCRQCGEEHCRLRAYRESHQPSQDVRSPFGTSRGSTPL